MAWRAWYAGGRRFDSSRHAVIDLPEDGCLIIMLWESRTDRRILQGTDYYFVTSAGAWDQAMAYEYSTWPTAAEGIRDRYPRAHVMRGMLILREEYLVIQDEAWSSACP